MTKKQKALLLSLKAGKGYNEIAQELGITKANVHTTCHRLRKRGLLPKRPVLTQMQQTVLHFYMEKQTVPEIAKVLGVTCQTVMNHATQGFLRLGLTTKGVDRVAALRDILEPSSNGRPAALPQPPTMEDPAFN